MSNKFTQPTKKEENNINKFIEKGATEPETSKKKPTRKPKTTKSQQAKIATSLMIPKSLDDKLSKHIKSMEVQPTRVYWILQAIQEKLDRDKEQ